jgi:hypothetical protein
MKTTTIHSQTYEYISWDDLGQEMFHLAQKILAKAERYDRIVALAKGGVTFARALADHLNIKEISSIQIEFYSGIGQTKKTPVITQTLPVSIRDNNILIVDDIVDSGETMQLATDYLRYHGIKNVATCTLISKPWSKYQVDFYVHPSEAWVIFPYESRETIQLLSEMWQKYGDSQDQIKKQLVEIGFSKAEVEFFLQIK